MAAVGASVTGVDQVTRRLLNLAKKVPHEVARALYEEAQVIALDSRRRTPVDTGALRASHHVERPVVSWRDVSVTIAVGGAAADYAIIVHEDVEAFHRVGQAKFLESAIRENAPYIAERVARRIDLNRMV